MQIRARLREGNIASGVIWDIRILDKRIRKNGAYEILEGQVRCLRGIDFSRILVTAGRGSQKKESPGIALTLAMVIIALLEILAFQMNLFPTQGTTDALSAFEFERDRQATSWRDKAASRLA